MPYPTATPEQIQAFADHGFIVVADAIDIGDLAHLRARCEMIIEQKDKLALDWAWQAGTSVAEREFAILQSSPTLIWPTEFTNAPFRRWAVQFASALMLQHVEFWYDQFLAKPPVTGAQTFWHQDEAYWGRNLDNRGITCWMPFHDVSIENGCMQFIDRGHNEGVLTHRRPDNIQSDLLYCEPNTTWRVATPVRVGSVTFHHSKTPHMTGPNVTDRWRKVLTQHLRTVGSPGEGDHYPWKVTVTQDSLSAERIAAALRSAEAADTA
ncbi:MAG: phytanoyl-CoA dioxygenase family protein [Streptosporangiaceae bacterium]